ncbi:MAG: hypothetical protein ACOYD0_06115 [Candidatus Nanopelagicales bacterium]
MELSKIVEAAGMTMARLRDVGELTIGVTGHRVLADFKSAQSRDEFLCLLAGADEVIERPPRASREEAYAAATA